MKSNKNKILLYLSLVIFALIFLFFALYLFVLPALINSKFFSENIGEVVNKTLNMEFSIEKPVLKTYIKPQIDFSVKKLALSKKKKQIVYVEDFDFSFSFKKIFEKEIQLNKLCAKNIYVEVDKILDSLPKGKSQENEVSFDYKIKFLNSKIQADKINLLYSQKNNSKVEVVVKNLAFADKEEDEKSLKMSLNANVFKNNSKMITASFVADRQIEIEKDEIEIDDLGILINGSKVLFSTEIEKEKISANVKSNKFLIEDIFKIINSDFIIPNGSELLKPLSSPNGSVEFDIEFLNNDLSGKIVLNNAKASLKDLSNLPLNVQKGNIKITNDKIQFIGLVGYYGKSKNNDFKIYGDIKDYYKTFDSKIDIDTKITNEFLNDYLAKLINMQIFVSKPSNTKVVYKSKNGIMDIAWFSKIAKGTSLNIGNQDDASQLAGYDRGVLGEFRIEKDDLEIKNVNYYIANEFVRGVKLKPILVLSGKMKLDGKIDKIGFDFGREMPCEFLNIFTNQKTFRKGTIKGGLHIEFKDSIPYLSTDLVINKTFIPSQRLYLRNAILKSDDNLISVKTDGKFKKADFDFNGKIKNGLNAPYVIKDMKLTLDNLDVERILKSFNNQNQNIEEIEDDSDEIADDEYMFDTNLIRIENSDFELIKGNFKELTFGNVKARMTLDENGLLKIQSNRFDIAQGISSLKVESDLKNLKHYIKLGIKDVDSNLMAKTLLNLDKEISGPAKGFIELNTDKDFKMNGNIKFEVENGTIGKIGLVEYLLKIASLFRNPLTMISPGTIMDVISIPEGKFDRITGDLKIKNNVVQNMNIKSYSDTLSALIKGRFDMEKHDASLRIYTRFTTEKISMFGFLRSLSLNSLANKMKMNSRNDANYYASELKELPSINVDDDKSQVFLTQVEGDIEHYNFLSSLKKIK